MFSSLGRSIALIKTSWSVLNKDKEILLFPILSAIVSIIVVVSFIIPVFIIKSSFSDITDNEVVMYGGLFIFYLITYFIVIFFNTGLVTCASIRMNGGDPTFSDGISSAIRHLPKIVLWSLISATIGVILSVIRDQQNIVGQILSSILGVAWTLLTFFVVPVMILEEKGVIDSIKESAALFRRTWGETVVGQGGITLVFGLLALVGLIPVVMVIFLASGTLMIAVIGLYLLFVVILAVIGSALQGIFNTALYHYAKTGSIPAAFNEDLIKNAFVPGKKGNI
jgi:hypothetical protein